MNSAEYTRIANGNIMIIVYYKTVEAINRPDVMLDVFHLDILWIGPMDSQEYRMFCFRPTGKDQKNSGKSVMIFFR
jgi:2,4-dihydroxyhept-2-ene-1,7-dioic acid aldolase